MDVLGTEVRFQFGFILYLDGDWLLCTDTFLTSTVEFRNMVGATGSPICHNEKMGGF